jgi:lactate dehydrogenase-like 2-hydroxyacid dehydrogenase
METVLVTELEFRKAESVFREAKDVRCKPAAADEAALAEAVAARSARAVIVGVAPYRGPLYEMLGKKNGAIIARFGVGHDSVNKPLARQHGIIVTNTPGVLDVSVAEHALWLMGCLVRKVCRLEVRMRAGEFAGEVGMELRGKTLGVLGFGAIGRRVAAIAHFGFGMKVVACDQIPPEKMAEAIAANGVERYTTDAEELLRQSDFVSVHLPVVPATQRFINATRLAWLKPGAMLVNTARGAVLDEEALYDALASGRLAGAGLDVFEKEPYVPARPDKDLRKLENVVLTPHVGSNTREANRRMAEASLENVRCFLAGKLDRLSRVDQP